MQWALELSDRLIALDFSLSEVKSLRREALLYIGARSSNPNKRNYILSSALELSDDFISFPETQRTSEGVKEISIDTIFSILSVRLNPEKVINKNMNEVMYSCDLTVKATEFNFKMAISGLTNPVMALATGDIEVDGRNTDFLKFLTYFQ